jgi:hypothetical protein
MAMITGRLSREIRRAPQPNDVGYKQEAAATVLGADALAKAMKKARFSSPDCAARV